MNHNCKRHARKGKRYCETHNLSIENLRFEFNRFILEEFSKSELKQYYRAASSAMLE